MYSSHTIANRLTALLVAHGVRHIVCCPGSRNGALVHNFDVCPDLTCHPVTDERSAGFTALGMLLATSDVEGTTAPIAVCVTSGSALLNVLPAVAEAYYRHLPLLVISADRPTEWVGQLEGQVIPQRDALLPYCNTTDLRDIADDKQSVDFAERDINRALLALAHNGGQPGHINVQLAEPLFEFSVSVLPDVRVIREYTSWDEVEKLISSVRHTVILVGQTDDLCQAHAIESFAAKRGIPVLADITSNVMSTCSADSLADDTLLLHVGGHTVDKSLRQALREHSALHVLRIEPTAEEFPDTFCHLTGIYRGALPLHADTKHEETSQRIIIHAANSSSIRRIDDFVSWLQQVPASKQSRYVVHCNRGTNGIEGCMSTAVGYARLASDTLNFLFIGDLAFFYDNNALWQQHLPANLRIVLINNGGGRIFDRLPGLPSSPAHHALIAADHTTSARGICEAFGVRYQHADALDTAALTSLLEAKETTLLEVEE